MKRKSEKSKEYLQARNSKSEKHANIKHSVAQEEHSVLTRYKQTSIICTNLQNGNNIMLTSIDNIRTTIDDMKRLW